MKPSENRKGCSRCALQAPYCCNQIALCDTIMQLNSQTDVDGLMELIVTRAANMVKTEHGFFSLYDPDSDVLELKGAVGFFSAHVGYQMEQGVGLTGKVVKMSKPKVVNNYQTWKARHPDPRWDPIRAIVAIPLTFNGQVDGQIGFVHTEKGRKFGNDDVVVLTRFAALANSALLNAKLSAEAQQELNERKRIEQDLQRKDDLLQETFMSTVNALASIVEMKDPYTAAHQRWVTRLACAIASEMDLTQDQIEGLYMAGLIHDIGKMNVPTELLIKPGQLSEVEYEAIKVHPQSGYDIVRQIQFPWPVAQIVLQHHERIDGSGYPQGISSTEILPEARILAVADLVEAMASHRPYRAAHGVEIALKEIAKQRGVLFDQEAVDACLKVFKKKGFTFE